MRPPHDVIGGFLILLLLCFSVSPGQERDKCGDDEFLARRQLEILGSKWGYGYDSLLVDLERWKASPHVAVRSIGKSVQSRDLWELTITSPTLLPLPRKTVYLHVRTHPSEVQSFWVTREMIRILLSDQSLGTGLRSRCTFCIVPMYNPDGVELEYPRQNANGIDLEGNWNKNPLEPEVAALRTRFTELMASSEPIAIALNMHSSYDCLRYFVYHDSGGTSPAYTLLERQFIAAVSSHFPGGFAPWNFFISWQTGTATQYPESWFWLNHREAVLAMTYEDMNCVSAGDFDKTALAVLHGIADYLGIPVNVAEGQVQTRWAGMLAQSYPNPVSRSGSSAHSVVIRYTLRATSPVRLALYDLLGRQIAVLQEGEMPAGQSFVVFDAGNYPAGSYFYRLETPAGAETKRLVLTH